MAATQESVENGMNEKILILDDEDYRHLRILQMHFGQKCFAVKTAEQAIKILQSETFTRIYLDHDLADEHYGLVAKVETYISYDHYMEQKEKEFNEGTGHAVARWLAVNPDRSPRAEIIVHSINPAGSARMLETLKKAGRKVKQIPFYDLRPR